MILKKSFKNIYLIAIVVNLTACSTLGKNANKNLALNAQCMNIVPMGVGERDANILKISAQACKEPQNAELWQQLAQQFFELGSYDKAVQSANTVLKLQPDNAAAKDIILRSGLKITGRGLEQMKGSMQFLYGDTWNEANKVASQINQSRGEKPLEVVKASSNAVIEQQDNKKVSRKKAYSKKVTYKKSAPRKTTTAKVKTVQPLPKPQSSKPTNPFSSFN